MNPAGAPPRPSKTAFAPRAGEFATMRGLRAAICHWLECERRTFRPFRVFRSSGANVMGTSAHASRQFIAGTALGLMMVCLAACNTVSAPPEGDTTATASKASVPRAKRRTPVRRPRPQRVSRASSTSGPGADGELSPLAATDLVWSEIEQALEFAPVMPVWIFDVSPSARPIVLEVSRRLEYHYGQYAVRKTESGDAQQDTLASLVIAVGQDVQFLLESPSDDPEAVRTACANLQVDETGQEQLFAAVGAALDRLRALRSESRGKPLVILVTDEAGDDAELVDELVEIVERESITVFAIGTPAPLGLVSATPAAERPAGLPPSSTWVAVRQGPETRHREHVAFEAVGEGAALNILDSGFGPFALEWLCRASGGTFLATRPQAEPSSFGFIGDRWPSPYVRRFARDVMLAYTPEYVTEASYRQMLANNAALRALHDAAQRAPVSLLAAVQREFPRTDEAQLSAALNKAQQEPAKLAPAINALYEQLKQGEADRDKILSRRGKVSYDLALSRAAVGKVRVDGYNAMLAKLKRGMSFQNPASTVWVLEPAEALGDSALERTAGQARARLEELVREHAGTPWAAIAEYELKQPWGWAWNER